MYTSIVSNVLTCKNYPDFWTVTVKVRVNGRIVGVYERNHCKEYTKGEVLTSFLLFLSGEIQAHFEGAIENDC